MADFEEGIIRKPVTITEECRTMLMEAVNWIRENSSYPSQAEIMLTKFYAIVNLLEVFPEIGTKCENGMRKFLLGKFPYQMYYKEKENEVEILGIWHTSRGTDFAEEHMET